MATTLTTTVSAVQAAFVTAAAAVVPTDVAVHRLWPGPAATERMVFFTEVDWRSTEDAVIKAGRRYRDENVDLNFEVWEFQHGEPDGGAEAIDAALAVYNACEGVVVQDASTVRAVAGVTNVVCQPVRLEPVQFDRGWAVVLTARLSVTARLT